MGFDAILLGFRCKTITQNHSTICINVVGFEQKVEGVMVPWVPRHHESVPTGTVAPCGEFVQRDIERLAAQILPLTAPPLTV